MNECHLLETISDLILQSITAWEDVHAFALTFSPEYGAFWELLDDSDRDAALLCQRQNRKALPVPFSLSHIKYFEYIMARESFYRIRGLRWDEQLKAILTDSRFRFVFANLLLEMKSNRDFGYSYSAASPQRLRENAPHSA